MLVSLDPHGCPGWTDAESPAAMGTTASGQPLFLCGPSQRFGMRAADAHCDDFGLCGDFTTPAACNATELPCGWFAPLDGTPQCYAKPCPQRTSTECSAGSHATDVDGVPYFGAPCVAAGSGCSVGCPLRDSAACATWMDACAAEPAHAVVPSTACHSAVCALCCGDAATSGYCAVTASAAGCACA